MPKNVKKLISKKVKAEKNELTPIELADDGWKEVWMRYALQETELLNTPNINNLSKLFKNYLGIKDFRDLLRWNDGDIIDLFIDVRWDITHKWNEVEWAKLKLLNNVIDIIVDNVVEIDSQIYSYLLGIYKIKTSWQEQPYFRHIESQLDNIENKKLWKK